MLACVGAIVLRPRLSGYDAARFLMDPSPQRNGSKAFDARAQKVVEVYSCTSWAGKVPSLVLRDRYYAQ